MKPPTEIAPGTEGTEGESRKDCRKPTTTKPKRKRRTSKELQQLLESCLNILGQYNEPISIRHLFYRLANDRGTIPKTEKAYNSLRSMLVKWRRSKDIPFSAFVDGTRWHYGFEGYSNGIEGMRALARQQYRLNLWQSTDVYLELWVEKDAIASIVHPIASEWNIKTFVTRGDASISSLAVAAEAFEAARLDGRRPVIIYLGDYDQAGIDIPKVIERNLLKDHGCKVELIRAGITEWQIEALGLPTRPPKDTKRGEAIEGAVEVDVLRPDQIREIVVNIIEGMVDMRMIERMKQIEAMEIEAMDKAICAPSFVASVEAAWGGGGS